VADNEQRLAQLQARGTPVVLVDSRSPSGSQCSVAVDDELGGDVAVSHLLAAGHERIAYVGGPFNLRQVSDRRDGALRPLASAGGATVRPGPVTGEPFRPARPAQGGRFPPPRDRRRMTACG
jgi:LacI family transcriptional regulator